jgi:diguanylate cyclase (GGDEF)-like protein
MKNGQSRTLPRKLVYAVAAMALSLGAPVGLLLVECLRAGQLTLARVGDELSGEPWTYAYVTVSTLLALSLFGHALGRQADHLIELSSTDGLTGLRNVRSFRDRLQEELARYARYRQPLSLLLLDLDGLKAINDTRGHRAGDAALVQLGAEIRAEARATDTCARWGGDEFAVLAPSTPEGAAAALAERICARLAAQGAVRGLAVSIGVVTLRPPADSSTADELVRAADRALYEAKRRGGNQVVRAAEGGPGPPASRRLE